MVGQHQARAFDQRATADFELDAEARERAARGRRQATLADCVIQLGQGFAQLLRGPAKNGRARARCSNGGAPGTPSAATISLADSLASSRESDVMLSRGRKGRELPRVPVPFRSMKHFVVGQVFALR